MGAQTTSLRGTWTSPPFERSLLISGGRAKGETTGNTSDSAELLSSLMGSIRNCFLSTFSLTKPFTNYLRLHPSEIMANDLSETAEAFLWIGFAIMFSSFTIFYAMLRTTAPGKRLFHVYTCSIVGFASTAYLWMALGTYKRKHD
jgi:hypothetical protein